MLGFDGIYTPRPVYSYTTGMMMRSFPLGKTSNASANPAAATNFGIVSVCIRTAGPADLTSRFPPTRLGRSIDQRNTADERMSAQNTIFFPCSPSASSIRIIREALCESFSLIDYAISRRAIDPETGNKINIYLRYHMYDTCMHPDFLGRADVYKLHKKSIDKGIYGKGKILYS